jgi:hypothetical protein
MKKHWIRLFGLALVLLAFVTSVHPAAAASYYYDFETTLSPWVKGNDPGAAASTLTRNNTDSMCPSTGIYHARLTVNPFFAPGSGVWMVAKFPANATTSVVKLTWGTKDQGNCAACYAMVYVGATPPASSAAFSIVGPVGGAWNTHNYSKVQPSSTGAIYVALGWRGYPPALPAAAGIDCVRISITP